MPLPWWVEVLQNAKDWGMAPWDLVQSDSKALWILRKRVYEREIAIAQKTKETHSGKK